MLCYCPEHLLLSRAFKYILNIQFQHAALGQAQRIIHLSEFYSVRIYATPNPVQTDHQYLCVHCVYLLCLVNHVPSLYLASSYQTFHLMFSKEICVLFHLLTTEVYLKLYPSSVASP